MNGSGNGKRRRRYVLWLAFAVLLVVGFAGASLFVGTGGSLLGWGGGIFGTNPRPPMAATLDRARQAAWRGEYDTALAALDSVIAARPAARELVAERARILGWAQRYEEAAITLAEVADPSDVEATLEQARYLWWAGLSLRADSLLSDLLRRHPGLEEARALQDLVRPGIEPDVDVARRWVDERPGDPFARLWLARALVESGRLGPALPHYRRAIGASGTVEPDVLMEAAGVALGADSLGLAGELLLRYLNDVDPADTDTRLRLARAYSWSGRWAEAAAQYRRVLAVQPDPGLRLELARMLATAGLWADAADEYRRVLAARPSLEARRELAGALAQLGRYAEAVRELDRVIEQDPDPSLLLEQAELLALMERYADAAGVLGRVLERQPDAHALRLQRARLLWWSGRLPEAEAELTTLLAARPDDLEARSLREDIREGIDASVEMARGWVELDDTRRNRLRLARVLAARDRYAEALGHYRRVLADSAAYDLVVEAVDVAEAADSLDAAAAILEEYLVGDSPDRALQLRLARLHGWAGRPAVSADVYARYLRRHPTDTGARLERARQLALQDSAAWDEAVTELERVVAADSARAPALKLLGDLHRWRGRPQEALAWYRRARAVDPGLEGLQEGMELATAMAEEAQARRDATRVGWAIELDAFLDAEDFEWVAANARRSWRAGPATLGARVGQRYAAGVSPGGVEDGAFGIGAALLAGWRLGPRVLATAEAGVTGYEGVGPFVTWGAGIELADSLGRAALSYDRLPGVRDATTMAALQAEAALHRLMLRTLYAFGDWQAAADVQLQAFDAPAGDVGRLAATVRADRPVGGSGVTAGAMVRAIFADGAPPVHPEWGPLLWAPVRYVAPALTFGWVAGVGDPWRLQLRASPGYAFLEERTAGVVRYRAGETAVLEAGATLGYSRGPWTLSVSGDWGGAIPDGYGAGALRVEVIRTGGDR